MEIINAALEGEIDMQALGSIQICWVSQGA